MHLNLAPATEADLDEIIDSQYRSFEEEPFHEVLYGPDTAALRKAAKERHLKEWAEDQCVKWLKVTDADTDRIVCVGVWKIYPQYVPHPAEEVTVDWWEGKEKEMAEHTIKEVINNKHEKCKEPHVCKCSLAIHTTSAEFTGPAVVVLYMLFTDPEFQRQGAGTMMVRWGCELADHLFLPAWVDSSETAHHLYLKNGFEDVLHPSIKTEKWDTSYYVMRRPAKVPKMESKFA
ncbi:MAG: hypothetical protein M1833_000243 [Piccolia ochrophora]|nr:MAG: hypothetical protein M1833_000243 [Piccolia ochrophora]